jgi:hypothetical protein
MQILKKLLLGLCFVLVACSNEEITSTPDRTAVVFFDVPPEAGHVIVTGTPTFVEDDGNGRSELRLSQVQQGNGDELVVRWPIGGTEVADVTHFTWVEGTPGRSSVSCTTGSLINPCEATRVGIDRQARVVTLDGVGLYGPGLPPPVAETASGKVLW